MRSGGLRPADRARRSVVTIAASAAVVAVGLAACSSSHNTSRSSSSPPHSSAPATTVATSIRSLPVGVGTPPLTATLTLAAARRSPAVVLVGGSGPNDQDETVGSDKPFLDLATGLAARGIATLRYDKRTRDYPPSINLATFTPTQEYVPDAITAIRLLRARPDIDPHRIYVLGHSEGGTFAPLIAKTDPEVAGVVLLAAAAEPLGADLVRQITYLSTLPGTIGARAHSELPVAKQAEQEIDNPNLAAQSPTAPSPPYSTGPNQPIGSTGGTTMRSPPPRQSPSHSSSSKATATTRSPSPTTYTCG